MRAWGLVVVAAVGALAGNAPPAAAQDGGLAVVSSRGIPQTLRRERPRLGWFGRDRGEQVYRGGAVGLLEAQPPKGFERRTVAFATVEPAGTIVIDSRDKFLYRVDGGGAATRYGIGVGRDGFAWAGRERISRKAKWPDWRPPAEMLQRDPDLPTFMDGGVRNPLGARALYLGSTLYRIHGTNEPWTIGTAVSSGCIRLTNRDVMDLFERTPVGATVIVLGPNSDRSMLTAALGGGTRKVASAPRSTPTALKRAPGTASATPVAAAGPVPRPTLRPSHRRSDHRSAASTAPRAVTASSAPAIPGAATPTPAPQQAAASSLGDRFGAVPWWKRIGYDDLAAADASVDAEGPAADPVAGTAAANDGAAAAERLPAIY